MAQLDFTEIVPASISTPASGVDSLFVDTTKELKKKDSNGNVVTYYTGRAATSAHADPWFDVTAYGTCDKTGVADSTAATGYVICHNDLTGNVTGGLNDLGLVTGINQKLVSDNLGVYPQGLLSATTAAVTVTANANTIVAGGLNVCPAPANSLKIGDTFRFSIDGSFTGTATATAIQVHLGTAGTTADAVILTASVTGAVGTSQARIVGEFTFRTIGAAGTVNGAILLTQVGATGLGNAAVLPVVCTTTTAPNTTTTNYFTVSLLSAASGSSGTTQNGIIEKL